jgi:uncharacterized protein YlzI (FlbEa/FlbD family)
MKLVKLQETKKRQIYVNAEKIQIVRPVNDHACMILFEGHALTVQHSMDELVKILEQEKLF